VENEELDRLGGLDELDISHLLEGIAPIVLPTDDLEDQQIPPLQMP
tara:strand:- start:840 stop:977 length:138 start_codon:yes stop_codon:yes gene_type:complete